jgi:organic radical activating enzyme
VVEALGELQLAERKARLMLIRITNNCDMGCTHCLIEATPDGEHMAEETFDQVVKFLIDLNLPQRLAMLSGGEPTKHPDLLPMIDMLHFHNYYVTVLSNGEFLHTNPVLAAEVLEAADLIQVTNDARFYPRHVPDYPHPKVYFERHIQALSPFGRAKEAEMPVERQAPSCFNLRSVTRATGTFQAGLMYLRQLHKLCTPSINPDGSISAGEARGCTKIGTVFDSLETITKNVRNMTCAKCGLVNRLDQKLKRAIGEASLILPGER